MAMFALDQSAEFVITCSAICRRWRWGWRKYNRARDELIEAGMLTQIQERLSDGSSCWHLNFDFTRLFESEMLSTGMTKSLGSRAGACEPTVLDGSCDPPPVAVLNLSLEPKETTTPTPQLAAGGEAALVSLALRAGLQEAAARRFAKAAEGASEQQLTLLRELIANPRAAAGSGWYVRLAQLAARGELEGRSGVVRPPEVLGRERLAAWRGRSLLERGAGGREWRVEADGALRGPQGLLLHPSGALEVLARFDANEIDLV